MATYYNPKIITNNIEFSVDAANVKSWSGPSLAPAGTPYGYSACGSPTRGAPNPYTQIDRIDYTNDTATALLKGNVIEPRQTVSSATANNTHGYVAGGQHPQTSAINRTDFANDTATAVAKGPLTITRRGHGGVGNNSYGYFGGGNDGSDYVSSVDRVDFSNDSPTAVVKGPLSTNQRAMGATGNASYGYWGGGYNPPAISTMSRLDYSSDTDTAVAKGPLSGTKYNLSATGNGDYGYWGGGSPWVNANTIVDRLDYSSDTTACVVKGPLAVATNKLAATGNTSYGYFMGGTTNPSGTYSIVQRIDYSNDTATSSPKGPLSAATRYQSGFSSQANSLGVAEVSLWKDMTGKGHNATVEGATYQGGNSGVWDFDGSGDYISYTDQSPYPLRNWWDQAWTVEYWMKADAFGQSSNGGSNVVGVTNLSTTGEVWSFGPEENGEVQWYYYNGSIQTVASGKTLSTGQWYHLVFAFDGSTGMKIFVNGTLEKSASVSGTPSGTSATFSIGKITSGGDTFNGKIALVRIYKGRGFTASEVLNNFNATRTRFGV